MLYVFFNFLETHVSSIGALGRVHSTWQVFPLDSFAVQSAKDALLPHWIDEEWNDYFEPASSCNVVSSLTIQRSICRHSSSLHHLLKLHSQKVPHDWFHPTYSIARSISSMMIPIGLGSQEGTSARRISWLFAPKLPQTWALTWSPWDIPIQLDHMLLAISSQFTHI